MGGGHPGKGGGVNTSNLKHCVSCFAFVINLTFCWLANHDKYFLIICSVSNDHQRSCSLNICLRIIIYNLYVVFFILLVPVNTHTSLNNNIKVNQIYSYISHHFKGKLRDVWSASTPVNTRHWSNVVLLLAHRLRHWTNIKTPLVECLLLASTFECKLKNTLKSASKKVKSVELKRDYSPFFQNYMKHFHQHVQLTFKLNTQGRIQLFSEEGGGLKFCHAI